MGALENLTPFGAWMLPTQTKEGVEALLICASARFLLPPPGRPFEGELLRTEEQPAPPQVDEHFGEPGQSSLKVSEQCCYLRPGADIYLSGAAWTPGGEPAIATRLAVRVGGVAASALVLGDRRWESSLLGGIRPSEPTPFCSIPLRWERSFGGQLEPRGEEAVGPAVAENPVGAGLYRDAGEAEGKRLPNFEREDQRIESFHDRPAPIGFGPVQRHWEPRVRYAGTYDESWRRRRAPFWPEDMDLRYFHAAPPYLRSPEPLRGGEEVQLRGLHAAGTYQLRLPRLSLALRVGLGARTERRRLALDALAIDGDAQTMSLTFRAHVPAPEGLERLRGATLRLLESWEQGGEQGGEQGREQSAGGRAR